MVFHTAWGVLGYSVCLWAYKYGSSTIWAIHDYNFKSLKVSPNGWVLRGQGDERGEFKETARF